MASLRRTLGLPWGLCAIQLDISCLEPSVPLTTFPSKSFVHWSPVPFPSLWCSHRDYWLYSNPFLTASSPVHLCGPSTDGCGYFLKINASNQVFLISEKSGI
jgi:hypothetical protein